jgi:hypothetical protein
MGTVGAGAYQESNPAVVYVGGWQQVASPDASGGLWRVAGDPADSATIAFHGTELRVLTRKGPDAPTIYVTLDGREANRLPRDRQGRSFADLYSPTPQPRALVTIAEELAPRDHVVRITLGGAGAGGRDAAFVLDGFEVGETEQNDPVSLAMPYLPYAVGALLVAGAAIVLSSRRRQSVTR